MGIERVVLEHHCNPAIFWLFLSNAPVVDIDIAGADALQSGHHAQQGRFTAAGWSDHHHKFAVIDGDIQRLNDLIFAHRRIWLLPEGLRLPILFLTLNQTAHKGTLHD
ncbi:Uncharacterised protein [Pantoea agglomerans]|uniref:Uncharacterized protein n=1 Tax=Enterobacter agglomerans TaxID=549 RepID=A0A379AAG7_ENTAG|nr:Uncharacterised protein [Pantoea agglomerans]